MSVLIHLADQEDASAPLRGFINLCRHRAAVLLDKSPDDVTVISHSLFIHASCTPTRSLPLTNTHAQGHGCGTFGSRITCRYHGWQYTPTGRLARALSMKGRSLPKDFNRTFVCPRQLRNNCHRSLWACLCILFIAPCRIHGESV